MPLIRLLVLTLLVALFPGQAKADYAFEFFQNGSQTSSISINGGDTSTVQVFLVQTGPFNGNANTFSSPGLFAGGIAVYNYSTSISGLTAISGNSSFDYIHSSGVGTGQGNLNEGQITSSPVTSSNSMILLGSFTFSGVSAGTTTVQTTLPNPDPPNANNVLGDGTNIDNFIANASLVITVAVVPEPGPLLLTGALAVGIAAGYARRRLAGGPQAVAAV